MDIAADFDARLGRGDVSLTAADRELLTAIEEEGSLNAAAAALDRSYAHAQRRVVELEEAFGPLVERSRGGSGGGGSELTDTARRLLSKFDRLRAEFAGVADAEETVLPGTVVERDGELAVVETAAGEVRAVTPPDTERVEVAVRADTVTLHGPDDAPDPGETSARNRFAGTVTGVDRGESLVRVRIDVGADAPLVATVTTESVGRLDLEAGDAVVASFKATATRAVPRRD
jgi:molybdate transport system regulatory protein